MAAPRAGKPRIPSYSLHKARGLACCKVGGKRVYLGPYGSPESHAAYGRVVECVIAGLPVTAEKIKPTAAAPVSSLTVAQLAERYLEHARGYYQENGEPTTEFNKVEKATERAVAAFGSIAAAEFGPLCLEEVRDRMIDDRLARSTINGYTRRITVIFKWAAAKQLVPASVPMALGMVTGLRAGRSAAKEAKVVEPVADDVVYTTVKQLPEVVADMVRLQRLTGARPGEVCAMKPGDIDRTGDVWLYSLACHKTAHHGKRRVVFIGPKAQAILLRYLARGADTYCFRPVDSEAKRRESMHETRTTPLSCGNRPGTNVKSSPLRRAGERYTTGTYANAIRRACKRAGVAEWTPHRLRHTCATAVRRDHGLEAAQIILGHSGAKVTEIYAERDFEKGAAVARLIG